MKNLFPAICLSFLSFMANAQDGSPILTHFREDREVENQNWAICQDTNKIMYFANRKGILGFDGEDWTTIRLPVTPLSMKIFPVENTIYVGGENSYGRIIKEKDMDFRYEPVSDSADIGPITRIIFKDSIACFYGENSISCHNLLSGKRKWRIFPPEGSSFTGAFVTSQNMFVNVSSSGLHRVEGDTLFPIVTGYITARIEILFSLPYNENTVLLGLGNGKLSLFDGIKFYDYKIEDDGYLKDNVLSDGISLGDDVYAFSTLGGGAIVCERKTGKIRYIINNMKGLPDDEIYAIGSDISGGLWLSHPLGLTRADLNLPAWNFGIYPGLTGNLSASLKYKNELYVATSEGIFYLANERRYTEVDVIKRNEIQTVPIVQKQPSNDSPPTLVPPSSQQSSRKGLLTRIFGKKESETKQAATTMPEQSREIITVKEVPIAAYTTEKVRKLKSIDYVYKKISGLDEKCRQMVPVSDGILAATNRGLYIIKDHKASAIVPDRYINFISWREEFGVYSVAASDGYLFVSLKNGKWTSVYSDDEFLYPVYSITRNSENTLWLGTDNSAVRVILQNAGNLYKRYSIENPFTQRYILKSINDTLFMFTETAINRFDEEQDKFLPYNAGFNSTTGSYKYPVSNLPLVVTGDDIYYNENDKRIKENDLSLLKLFDDLVSVYFDNDYIWVVDGDNRLYGINTNKTSGILNETSLLVKHVSNEKGKTFDLSDIVFERGDNIINFEIIVPTYLNKNLTQYQYFIQGLMDDWSPWSSNKSYSRGIPEPGDYILKIRAKDLWGQVGEPVSLNFTIKAPFTQTSFFYILVILSGLALFLLIIRFRERQLHEKNRILEEKVKERTAEIEAQKEEITSSIEYASRIQLAMLPFSGLFSETFSDYFIIFKPRDIVSGDFYWIGADDKNLYLTVADCTGHGVPGAFMSTLGISVLNEIVTQNGNLKANIFLNLLREKIKMLLHQTGKEGEAADGMDISLCVLSKNRQKLQFSGAYNPLYIYTGGELVEIKADRMPIGIFYGEEASFTNNEINIRKGDILYLLSDGLTDQFGGPDGSKFKKAQLKKLLSEIYMRPMSEQKKLIELEFLKWKGQNEQVDDVTFIGVRI
ncbi:MAG TPA: SpoIIE family protein phosphatase [Bacteroidales bacterium]|nr:SpoIIE family protein phosphatase [Bacteroidales bacterium]